MSRTRFVRTLVPVAACIIGTFAASCNTRARESTSSSTTATGSSGSPGQHTSDSATAGATGQPGSNATGAAPTELRAMSDANILATLAAANDAGAADGRLAESQGSSAAVRSFAHRMVADHTAAQAKGDRVAQHAGITPEPGALVPGLQQRAATVRDTLQQLEGVAFDRAYVGAEIAMDEQVLDLIDRAMTPGARHPEVRSLLEQVRPVFAQHLTQARALGTQLTGGE